MKEIVKVQLPLASGDPAPRHKQALVYAEGRKNVRLQALSRATLAALAGDSKGYFEACLSGFGWHIGRRVEEQSW